MKELPTPEIIITEKEPIPQMNITTRSVILTKDNYILLLEKSSDSKNPGALEHPGGNIDKNILTAHDKNQLLIDEAKREITEETSVFIDEHCRIIPVNKPQQDINSSTNYFEYSYQYNHKIKNTGVYCYLVNLPFDHKELTRQIAINKTKNTLGISEDKHQSFKLLTLDEYNALLNQNDKNDKNFLANNSKININHVLTI